MKTAWRMPLWRLGWMGGAALALAMLFTWPLPKMAGRGIAASAQNPDESAPLRMIPGDHLQFLYHMWLAQDTFTGHTPLFHNLYEFNTGDDAERRAVTPYYLPFSAFFTLGALAGGPAAGWNFALWMSLWLTGVFSWMLARRFTPDERTAGMLALVPMALPYVWMNLLGGSPTGLAMMWIPLLLYGIDRWVRDGSAVGAALAGAVVFFSEWSDTHVFFFSALVSPPWALFCYVFQRGVRWPTRREVARLAKAAWPLLVFVALVGLKAWGVRQGLQDSAVAGGRSPHEVALFSTRLEGLWRTGTGAKTYLGWVGLGVLAALGLAGVWACVRRPRDPRAWCLAGLVTGIAGLLLLASGPLNPLGPRLWNGLIRLVPPYGMIRQPDKIFCLLPALWVAAFAVADGLAAAGPRRIRRVGIFALAAVLAGLVWEWAEQIHPVICVLDARQDAYAAVAERAEQEGQPARALALPLWPGDSHYSSVYQYDSSLYRIRMVNGYRPTARKAYVEEIFNPLESMNLGWPSDGQLDDLQSRGVEALILHENVFPEKVSSFPVGATLAHLTRHPRLRFLAQQGPVWSFAILPSAPRTGADKDAENGEAVVSVRPPEVLFPVRVWEWERSAWDAAEAGAETLRDPLACGGAYVRVRGPMEETVGSRWIRAAGPDPLEWRLRARGHGTLEWTLRREDDSAPVVISVPVEADDWSWLACPVPAVEEIAEYTADIRVTEGELDLDALLLTRAGWQPPRAGETLRISATCFFHAGQTLPGPDGAVRLLPEDDPQGEIFYSRHLFLEPGRHRFCLELDAPDTVPGTPLGQLTLKMEGAEPLRVPVVAGAPAELVAEVDSSRYFRFAFDYGRTADVTIRALSISNE